MESTNYDLGKAFEAIEEELIASMMRNFEKHKKWETEEGFNWSAWQVEQLKSLEEYRLNNRNKFSKDFRRINKKIPELIKWAKEQGGADEEADLLRNIGSKPNTDKGVSARFFGVQNAKLDALVNATTNDLERAEYAVLRKAEDEYRSVIYKSVLYANTGAGTYAQAVDMATKDFLSRGIQCIEYKNGSRHTISDYADMAIRTANKRAYLMGQGERRAEWGEHLVIVNKRQQACPKCMKFQGRVFIDDVYSGGVPEDGDYPLLSEAMEQGLYHPRCKDGHGTYYEGISEPPTRPTRADFVEAVEQEEQETRLATAERNAERFARLAKYSLDPQNKQKYEARANEWDGVAQLLDVSNEKPMTTRLIGGYQEIKTALGSFANAENVLPQVCKNALNGTVVNLGASENSCDFKNGIINLVADCTVEEALHEIGHRLEYVMFTDEEILQHKKYLTEGLTRENVQMEIRHNPDGTPVTIWCVQGERFISTYQGRIYSDTYDGCFDNQGNIRLELMLETISEPTKLFFTDKKLLDEYQTTLALLEGKYK